MPTNKDPKNGKIPKTGNKEMSVYPSFCPGFSNFL